MATATPVPVESSGPPVADLPPPTRAPPPARRTPHRDELHADDTLLEDADVERILAAV